MFLLTTNLFNLYISQFLFDSERNLTAIIQIVLAVKLQSQERIHLLLKACRTINRSEKPNYTKKMFKPKQSKPSEKEIELACLDFARKVFCGEPSNIINQPETTQAVNGSTSMPDKPKPEALLIVEWQATITDSVGNKRTAIGQNHLSVVSLSGSCASKDVLFVLPHKNETSMDQSLLQPLLGPDVNKLPGLQKQVCDVWFTNFYDMQIGYIF